jgi:hypothetical protein
VCPSSSGQLQITQWFWNFYAPAGMSACFASLENTQVNPWLALAMKEYGCEIQSIQNPSIFTLSSKRSQFGHLVLINACQTYSVISPFLSTLEILFGHSPEQIRWNIPPPESLVGSDPDIFRKACELRDRIEFEVVQLAQMLES